MIEINSAEALMVWVMNRFSETLGEHAILKGGMVLRLLDCPRYTNDLDYIFVPFDSKKKIWPMIERTLQELDGARIQHEMNSKCLRIRVTFRNYSIQIESNVMLECKTQPMSTSAMAKRHNQLPRVIRVMRFDWALANKLAAWNERELIRDLYDAHFLSGIMNEKPDLDILIERLQKINYTGKTRHKNLPKSLTLNEFVERLKTAVKNLTAKEVEQELRDYLAPEELAGLDKRMTVGLMRLADNLLE